MREIDLYVALTGNKNNFKFLSVVIDEEGEKEVYKELEETTSNRAIIVGISEVLKEECDNLQINIHTPTNFGFRYMNKLKENKSVGNWTNKDVAKKLYSVINDKNLHVKYINYGENEKSDFVNSLKSRLIRKYKVNNDKNIRSKYLINIENNIYNPSEKSLDEVKFYVRGVADSSNENKIGKYIVIMNYKGIEKELSNTIYHTTSNRMIIQGVIDAIDKLKRPCCIKLYTHAVIGLETYYRQGSGTNKDLIKVLFEKLTEGGHSMQEYICADRQEELSEKLKKIK